MRSSIPVSPNPEVAATLAALQENAAVFALVPSGNDLYVGGSFTTIGGLNARGVARYNLQSGVWTALGADNVAAGNGVNGLISTILVVGNDVYVGGSFTKAYNNSSSAFISANCIAKWNTVSKTWSALGADAGPGGNGFDGDVVALVALNGSVYLGGTFHNAHNANGNDVAVNGIARWNNGWFALGKGTSTASNAGVVNDLAVIGNDLYVGGSFSGVTNTDNSKLTVDCIARWNTLSSAWAVLGAGNGSGNNGVSGDVFTLTTNGTELYVGGGFSSVNNSTANKVPANHLARWNGTSWGVVGSAATANSNGVNGNVTELSISNGVLYVGGSFDSTINNGTTSSANCIARWTGSAWERFGTGTGTTGNGVDQDVWVIAPIGNMIYVGGEFTSAYNSSGNTVNVTKLARWNGSSWSGLSAAAVKALATVSAASFSAGELTAEGIVAAYGTGLATTTLAATTTPLPTTLAGTSVAVRDSAGVTRSAPLFFVSGGQINFMIPTGTAAGVANITVTSGDASLSGGDVTVANVAPGLFTMNTNGQGVVAAVALRTKSNGVQTYETVADFNTSTQRWVTKPIDLGPATDVVYLIAYGSGFRNRSALANVSTTIGGTAMLTDFAGKQGGLVGVDQLNVKLDRSLIGRGELDLVLRVDNKPANTVKVNIK
ncbi:MAG: hypothetical protein HYR56_03105 [Acidobacteria bacterium]|nr:hypothetical protein [Acidobacteriota bacterium]